MEISMAEEHTQLPMVMFTMACSKTTKKKDTAIRNGLQVPAMRVTGTMIKCMAKVLSNGRKGMFTKDITRMV